MPRLGRFSARYNEIENQAKARAQPGRIDHDTPSLDLANDHFGKAKVRCWLEADGRVWGKWRGKDAVALQLVMTTEQPMGCKLCHFQLDMEFTQCEGVNTDGIGARASQDNKESVYPVVWLVKGPFPRRFERSYDDDAQSAHDTANRPGRKIWIFKSNPVPGIGGIATSASWMWEANQRTPEVEDCGTLFGAIALRHDGQPFKLSCRVSGKGYKSRFRLKFDDQSSGPHVWLLQPDASEEDVSKDIEHLEDLTHRLNRSRNGPSDAMSLLSSLRSTSETFVGSSSSSVTRREVTETETAPTYGASNISGSARVHMGNIELYNCQFNSTTSKTVKIDEAEKFLSDSSGLPTDAERTELAEIIRSLRRM